MDGRDGVADGRTVVIGGSDSPLALALAEKQLVSARKHCTTPHSALSGMRQQKRKEIHGDSMRREARSSRLCSTCCSSRKGKIINLLTIPSAHEHTYLRGSKTPFRKESSLFQSRSHSKSVAGSMPRETELA